MDSFISGDLVYHVVGACSHYRHAAQFWYLWASDASHLAQRGWMTHFPPFYSVPLIPRVSGSARYTRCRSAMKIPAGAGVHGGGQHEAGGKGQRHRRSRDADGAILEWLAHDL